MYIIKEIPWNRQKLKLPSFPGYHDLKDAEVLYSEGVPRGRALRDWSAHNFVQTSKTMRCGDCVYGVVDSHLQIKHERWREIRIKTLACGQFN
jgi:hypothetical protein